jgi:hypothetical protein
MEMARHHLASASIDDLPTPEDSQPVTPEDGALKTTDRYAYAFDIGIVDHLGKQVLAC